MMQHLNVKEKSDPNKLGTLTETVLPYVNGNSQNVNISVNNMDWAMKQLYQDVISITQDLSINFMDMKDEINANVREHISFMKEILKEEIGKRSMLIKVTMTM